MSTWTWCRLVFRFRRIIWRQIPTGMKTALLHRLVSVCLFVLERIWRVQNHVYNILFLLFINGELQFYRKWAMQLDSWESCWKSVAWQNKRENCASFSTLSGMRCIVSRTRGVPRYLCLVSLIFRQTLYERSAFSFEPNILFEFILTYGMLLS